MNEQADKIFAAVNGYLERSLRGFIQRLTNVELSMASVRNGKDGAAGKDGSPGPRGEKGETGERGERGEQGIGAKGDQGEKGERGEAGPQGERGEQGAMGVPGNHGENGLTGSQGERGERGEKGEPGAHGKDVDEIRLRSWIAEAVSAIPAPADGREGKRGMDGRDATQIEYVTLDPERSYPRGTHACYAGGILRAARTTDPFENDEFEVAGWQALVVGIKSASIEVSEDARDYTILLQLTVGHPVQAKFHVPVQKFCGVWKEGEYQHGDTVTWGGSNWHANRVTHAKPGINTDWTLMVKRGSDGRDRLQ